MQYSANILRNMGMLSVTLNDSSFRLKTPLLKTGPPAEPRELSDVLEDVLGNVDAAAGGGVGDLETGVAGNVVALGTSGPALLGVGVGDLDGGLLGD